MGTRTLTEIHTHILSSVDDGAADMEESLAMLKEAVRQGVGTIIATPHYYVRQDTINPDEKENLIHRLNELCEKAKESGLNVQIYLGNELYMSPGALTAMKASAVVSLAGTRYYLIECAYEESYAVIYQTIRDLIMLGVAPVLAHVERYSSLHNRINRISELIELGCYIQVNAKTILENEFSSKYRYVKKLLQQDMVHFIASDCHDTKRRPPLLLPCYKKCEKILTETQLSRIFYENPEKLLQNKYI